MHFCWVRKDKQAKLLNNLKCNSETNSSLDDEMPLSIMTYANGPGNHLRNFLRILLGTLWILVDNFSQKTLFQITLKEHFKAVVTG